MGTTIRFQFSKGDEVRFLSHLDLIRTMERAIRRAKLPIALSEGFNPRPKMSFSFPLAVGILSRAEYGDFQLTENMDPAQFMDLFNGHLPTGIRVIKAEKLGAEDSLMRFINAASYELVLPSQSKDEVLERWQLLKNMDTFFVERQTKKRTRKLDVLPMLHEISSIIERDQGVVVTCLCALGDQANLRMDELGQLLQFDHLATLITRTGQFKKDGLEYFPPLGV